ncbi:hypothetical protein [Flavobacterium sp. RS13.1]|jgi:hypothetical protein|uniref:hypothetical protein n=1 Tax=Flavobacterium sp. RS13.1 TaxID=3400345 RepID=UPI003AB0A638
MKKITNVALLILATTMFISCSNDDASADSNVVGKWEFSKVLTYNELNQEVFEDYNHNCSTNKNFIQLDSKGEIKENFYDGDCEVEINAWTYKYKDNIIKLYNGSTLISYQIKVLSLTSKEMKIEYISNSSSQRKGTNTYILVKK